MKCSREGCTAEVANHYWGRVKATGWIQFKDGHAFCPDHIPEWVAKWREQKRKEKRARAVPTSEEGGGGS